MHWNTMEHWAVGVQEEEMVENAVMARMEEYLAVDKKGVVKEV